jgi:autotransporter-associated beta strand protein
VNVDSSKRWFAQLQQTQSAALEITSMKPLRHLAFATSLLAAANASAAPLTWLTTNGTWDLSTANWTGPVAWTQTSATVATNAAIFAGTDGAVGAYTVTAGTALATQSLTFNNTGYKLYSTGTSKTITVTNAGNSTSVNFSIAAGKTASIGASGIGVKTIVEHLTSNLHIGGGGTLKIDSGGTFQTTNATAGGGILLGNVTVDLASGGEMKSNAKNGNFLLGYTAGTTSVLNINGGTAQQSFNGANGLIVGNLGNGTLNISATAGSQMLSSSPNMQLASGGASSGTVNLDGGLLSVRAITKGSGTATFNFNGGTLRKAATSTADFLNFTSVVKSGGAVIDTNGVDATISGAMSNGGGNGGLTKFASGGILTLSGANTYTGTTTVNGGTIKAGIASVADTSGAFGKNSSIVLANTAGVAMDITGFNTQIGSLTGGGTTGGNVILGAATLSVGGDNTSPAAYAGVISGSGGLTKIGIGTLTLGNVSTYLGNTTVNQGTLHLADNAGLNFKVGANGVNNSMLGTATLLLDGDFTFDLTTAGTLIGNSWNIVNVGTLGETFGSTFTLASTLGAFTNNSGIWTRNENSVTYQFEQSTGVLSVVPEPSAFGLAALGLTSLVLRRRRRQA